MKRFRANIETCRRYIETYVSIEHVEQQEVNMLKIQQYIGNLESMENYRKYIEEQSKLLKLELHSYIYIYIYIFIYIYI